MVRARRDQQSRASRANASTGKQERAFAAEGDVAFGLGPQIASRQFTGAIEMPANFRRAP